MPDRDWSLLVYKLPPQPTRLRIQVWRKLQALGAIYLQDGVAAVPTRDDLEENLRYIAASVQEMGGSAIVLRAAAMQMVDGEEIVARFRRAADQRMSEILEALGSLERDFPEIHSIEALAQIEEAIKKERVSYLKARRLSYCGSELEARVEEALASMAARLTQFAEGTK